MSNMNNIKLIKALLIYLVFSNGITGIWALFFPMQFHTSFPGFGFHWIDIMGAYNEHLIRDVGAFFCAIASLSLFAVIEFNLSKIKLACQGNIVFAVPHLLYHCYMIHMFPTLIDKVLGILAIALAAGIPILILVRLSKSQISGK